MATAGGPNPPPIHVIEEHGLTEISVHCDVALSEAQLGRINSNLQEAGLPPVGNRKRRLRWATPGEGGGFWEFRIELYTLSERSGESPSMHVIMVGDKVVRREPSAHMRSRGTVETGWHVVSGTPRGGIRLPHDLAFFPRLMASSYGIAPTAGFP